MITRQPPIRAVFVNLYPHLDNLDEAIGMARSLLPIQDDLTLIRVLMTYHNTLLRQAEREKENVTTHNSKSSTSY